MAREKLEQLKARLAEAADIDNAASLLQWDMEVYMPPKGAEARGMQLATLSALKHRLFTSAEVGDLLSALDDAGLSEDERRLVDVTRYDYDRASALPEEFVHEFSEAQTRAYHAWIKARAESSFPQFQPHLEKIVELNQRRAEYHGYEGSPYNALLEDYERGMTVERLTPLFDAVAPGQSELVRQIGESSAQPNAAWLKGEWDEQAQWDFSIQILKDIGYDFEAGRQDKSVHPFTTNFDMHDVRITTRLSTANPFSALMGSLHEGGHALYEQGIRPEDRRTPLAGGTSLGIHESQSRLWENVIGRSLPFWKRYTPLFKQYFPDNLDGVGPEEVYAAVNRVTPSLIRVEADECTYNLHIILRYRLERGLIEGRLAVEDVPEAWNASMNELLGVDVPNDAEGCLQDIHWSHGAMGYFPTYALGNLYAAQLLQVIERDVPGLWEQVEQGAFAPLLTWLRERIHQHGRRYTPVELMERICGEPPDAEPYLSYLTTKYGALYGL